MSVTGPDVRSVATELITEARRRLIEALLRPRSTTSTANAQKPQQVPASTVAKHIPAGLDPGRSRLAASLIDTQLLEAGVAEANNPAPTETAAARAVSNYLGNDAQRLQRADTAMMHDRLDVAAQPIVGARPDVLAATGYALVGNRQIDDGFEARAAPVIERNADRAKSNAASHRVKKLWMITSAGAAALLFWLLYV